jgi:hypothetical protein
VKIRGFCGSVVVVPLKVSSVIYKFVNVSVGVPLTQLMPTAGVVVVVPLRDSHSFAAASGIF